jgi:hypothetical protein
MNIHLERVRSKAIAQQGVHPDDATSWHAYSETTTELQSSESCYFDDFHALDEESASELDSFCLGIGIPEEELNERYNPLRVLPGEGCRREDISNSTQTSRHLSWSSTSVCPFVEVDSGADAEAVDLFTPHAFRYSQN